MNKEYARQIPDEKISTAAEYARQLISEKHYEEGLKEFYDLDSEYDDLEDGLLVEIAASVISGDYPELNDSIEYNRSDRIDGEDFIEMALELSGKPKTGEKELSELEGTTQVGDEELDHEKIRSIRNMLINQRFKEEKNGKGYLLKVAYYTGDGEGNLSVDYAMDIGETMDMDDRINSIEDERDLEEWP